MGETITFPYASMQQAIEDRFAKLGGAAEAFRFLSNGYKQTLWRKDSMDRRQDKVKKALKLLAEHEAKEGKNRQAGR